MSITLRLFSPAPLREIIIRLLLFLVAWQLKLAQRLGYKKPHTGGQLLAPDADALMVQPVLADALGFNKAVILQKVYEWMLYNERVGKRDHRIDGEWYTYRSAAEWQAAHFTWLAVSTVKRLFQELETDDKLLRSIQHRKDRGDCRKWVTIPPDARAKIATICAASPSAQKTPTPAQVAPMPESNQPTIGAEESPTNGESSNENIQSFEAATGQQQQPLQGKPPVVVVDPPSREPEPESGEIILEDECEGRDTAAVKAFVPHEQLHDNRPISPIPQHPSFPALAAKLVNTLEFEPGFAETLIRLYGAGRVRAVAIYIESQGGKIHTPPAYMRSELEKNELGLGSVDSDAWDLDSTTRTDLSPLSPDVIDYDAERIAELEAREHIPPLPEPVGLDERPDGSMAVREIWLCAHDQMRLLFGLYEFETMLKHARLFSYEQGTFRIGVPTAPAQDMLQHRFYRSVQRIIEGLHSSPVNLVFEVCPSLNWNQRPLTASEIEELHRLRADRALV